MSTQLSGQRTYVLPSPLAQGQGRNTLLYWFEKSLHWWKMPGMLEQLLQSALMFSIVQLCTSLVFINAPNFFFTFFFQELPPECKNGGCFVSKPTAAPKQRRSGMFTYKDVPRGRLGKCVCEDDYISCWRRSNKGLTESDAIPGNSSLRLTHSTKSKSGFRLEVLKSGILSAVFAKYRVTRSCTSSC